MKSKKLELVDVTDQYEDGTFKKCILAINKDYQIEFYQPNNENDLVNSYKITRDALQELSDDNTVTTLKELGNYSKLIITDSSTYYVLSRSEDTFIFITGRLIGLMSCAFVASKVFGVKKIKYSAFGVMSETDGIRYTEWNYKK